MGKTANGLLAHIEKALPQEAGKRANCYFLLARIPKLFPQQGF
jgi:hypothetical protein